MSVDSTDVGSTDEVLTPIDGAEFRRTLGHFCSGVTVLAGFDASGEPTGLACQSFTSLSLNPPLVLCAPAPAPPAGRGWPGPGGSASTSSPRTRPTSAPRWGRSGPDKFDGVSWHRSPRGALVLDGVLAWLDCDISAVHPGGDHHIVVGAVRQLSVARHDGDPLLFFRGRYGLGGEERRPA